MIGRILAAGTAVGLTGVWLYVRHLHRSLAGQVSSKKVSAEERKAAHNTGEIQTLPTDLIGNPDDFRLLHVQDQKSASISIPHKEEENATKLFTLLLRRNMQIFAKMPQSWIMSAMTKTAEQKRSFSKEHIQSLEFQEGDLFCGFNRVLKRDPLKVEIELVPPESMGSFSGRLVIALITEGNTVILRTQTLQWTKAAGSAVLPLERRPAKFMHEIGSWYLIVSGLDNLKKTCVV